MHHHERRLRVALYSHDTQGLGHIRRNLAIAAALAGTGQPPAVLMVAGTQVTNSLVHPAGVDCLTLPAIGKNAAGAYEARQLPMPVDEVLRLRADAIAAGLAAFQPDVLIVDKVPAGLMGELIPALKMLRRRGRTRCILGLRDILDEPHVAAREWRDAGASRIVQRYYDAVWVYGDPAVYDAVREYAFLDAIAAKIRFTGYINRCEESHSCRPDDLRRQTVRDLKLPVERLALCTVGGGQDGFSIAEAFVRADLPADTGAVVLAGPFMEEGDRRRLLALARHRSRTRVVAFTPHPERLLGGADWVVSMAGYNTTCEILAANKRALLVPRVRPRLEQWIRAERLAELGAVSVIHPDALTPDHISRWLAGAAGHRDQRPPIDMHGLRRVPALLQDLLRMTPSPAFAGVQPIAH